jgi:Sporulation and spore germination
LTVRRVLAISALAIVVAVLAWELFVGLPRWYAERTRSTAIAPPPAAAPAAAGPRINARLFYVSDDGTRLTGFERDVPFGEGPVEQARQIIAAQIAPVAEPLVSPVPPGTKLRSVFLTTQGEAYVDLSHEVSTAHSGGTLDELLTVYCIVNALTVNLPAVKSVQLLIDGKEVPTLAGHVDLRRPLAKDLAWIQ